ncbi:MATE family efflux transporter [Rhodobacter sp. SY28-1]|uniref:MATE family efflux transporter n=1 Tax=Rhodobacter sp. SY28-1 TaxID=2562317 RepID=UPI0010C0C519|nr:MATE family efflux transporter [Rhodobacter sp. SY28-1]
MTYTTLPPVQGRNPALIVRLRGALDEPLAMLRLTVPIMLIALINMGMSITDTLMVSSSFGAEALAALAVGSDFYSILFYLGAGTIGGLVPFYTAAVARADHARRLRLEQVGRSIVLLLSAVLVPIVWTAPDWLVFLGLDAGLLEAGRGYTRSMALTLVPMLGVMLYRTMLTASERPRVFLYVTAATLPLNAVGNHLLMHGFGPIPALGPTGAGLSTLIVAIASLATLTLIARRSAPQARTESGRIAWSDLAPVLQVGLPIGIATVAELGIFLGATLYAATLSPADVAAHTLTLRLAGVAYAVPAALLQAAMVRMARVEATGDLAHRRRVIGAALWLSGLSGLLLFLGLCAAAVPLTQAFFEPTAVGVAATESAVMLLILLGAMELVANPGLGASGLLRGRKDTRVPMVYTLAGNWCVGAPLGLWFSATWLEGIAGVWAGLMAGTLVTSCLMLARLANRSRLS